MYKLRDVIYQLLITGSSLISPSYICLNQNGDSLGQGGTSTLKVRLFFTIAETSHGDINFSLGENVTLHMLLLLTPGK